MNRHKNLHKDLINGINSNQSNQAHQSLSLSLSVDNLARATLSSGQKRTLQQPKSPNNHTHYTKPQANGSLDEETNESQNHNDTSGGSSRKSNSDELSLQTIADYRALTNSDKNVFDLDLVECLLLLKLCDVALKLPIDSRSLQRSINKIRGLESTPQSLIENLLQKFAHQELITIEEPTTALLSGRNKQTAGSSRIEDDGDDESCIYVTSADHTKLVEFDKSYGSLDNIRALLVESKADEVCVGLKDCEPSSSNQHISVPIQSVRQNLSSTTNKDSLNNREDIPRNQDSSHRGSRELQDYSDATDSSRSSDIYKISRSHHFSNNSVRLSVGHDVESLLSLSSTKERESKKLGEELLELLSKPTAKERNLLERFRSADGYQVQEFCPKGTKGDCSRKNNSAGACDKLHFKKIIAKHTEESLGDCSFLNTCFHMDSCKYVHYEVDYDEKQQSRQHKFKRPHPAGQNTSSRSKHEQNRLSACNANLNDILTNNRSPSAQTSHQDSKSLSTFTCSPTSDLTSDVATMCSLSAEEQAQIDAKNRKRFKTVLYPPQWIQCDLRFFDMSLLGKFSVVMADPPWDIHMELPYGTMSDEEMRKLNIPALQDDGVIFLWVTGRAMELGRECLALWGYERCDEIIWVKTNQLQRIIRTGRTGHWLNHGKEHCLVGVKGNPKDINRGLDCDVIVAEVRATSHKPDEIYGIIERLSPGTRKIELFGRAHNVQPNWITLGNQLNGVRLIEPNLVNAFKKLNMPFQAADHVA